ncbi:MAG: DUF371 domain-containing protein [Nitrososphaeria archaeon]|nr:DUF371 domain-containing protein [Nitrosopumilaceae archaeon]NIP09238.1 DUF371 domain-containing protein [Nitrosopumilaceae archaeon]NIP91929.1 DUF371 domain-containing protein [Nitrososphaeria archaeon]NIS96022.1 DUF371 domain-containing protein [Nitrosopumilaceae archaeon]
MRFEIEFFGHENIRSTHQKTIEITKEKELTPRGDCIVGVGASASCFDIPEEIKEKLKDPESKVQFLIKVQDQEFIIQGRGHKDLTLTHKEDIVIRKSDFVCPRTLAVKCDKASDILPRDMVKILQNPTTKATFTIDVQ